MNSGVGMTCRLLRAGKRDQVFFAYELGGLFQSFPSLVHECFRGSVLLRDFVQRFLNHAWRGQLGHLLPHVLQSSFRFRQNLFRSLSRGQRITELGIVFVFSQPPIAGPAETGRLSGTC